jgi:hypothetical protein
MRMKQEKDFDLLLKSSDFFDIHRFFMSVDRRPTVFDRLFLNLEDERKSSDSISPRFFISDGFRDSQVKPCQSNNCLIRNKRKTRKKGIR